MQIDAPAASATARPKRKIGVPGCSRDKKRKNRIQSPGTDKQYSKKLDETELHTRTDAKKKKKNKVESDRVGGRF